MYICPKGSNEEEKMGVLCANCKHRIPHEYEDDESENLSCGGILFSDSNKLICPACIVHMEEINFISKEEMEI